MRVLVTGASGFVGRHVVRELSSRGHELILPSSSELDLTAPVAASGIAGGAIQYGMPLLCAPLAWIDRSIDAFVLYLYQNKPDAIVHLAATCGGIGINKDNPGKFIYENLQMGINVLEAARLANISKVVNLGTVCAYPKFTPVPFKESDLWSGYPEETNAPYGIAKKTVIEMAIAYYKQYGLNVTNLLPANMAGEYDHFDEYSSHVIPAIIKKFECRQDILNAADTVIKDGMFDASIRKNHERPIVLWGTGSASREFLYAGDCARAIALALERDTGPDPINLGTGREVTIADLAAIIKEIGKYEANIEWDSSKPDGQPRRSLDTSRAKERLDWEATTSLEEMVRRTIEWYRTNGK